MKSTTKTGKTEKVGITLPVSLVARITRDYQQILSHLASSTSAGLMLGLGLIIVSKEMIEKHRPKVAIRTKS